jgi:hypothetical protein
VIAAEINNSAVTTPLADIRLWEFSGSSITIYSGDHGTILAHGPPASTSTPPMPALPGRSR